MSATSRKTLLVTSDELEVGKPIPWSVYDSNENLLLRRGFLINSERQRIALIARGVRREVITNTPPGRPSRHIAEKLKKQKEPQAENTDDVFNTDKGFRVFELLEALIGRLGNAYDMLSVKTSRRFFPIKIQQIALDIQSLCMDDPDAVLGAMQLDETSDYALIHPIHTAILCELIASRMGVSMQDRLSLVAAAASHDVGIMDIQDEIHNQSGQLSDQQWNKIKGHPLQGFHILRECGITDSIWLDAVRHHHERADGTGYPEALEAHQIPITTRILAVADCFSAMTRKRQHRGAKLTHKAVTELFVEGDKTLDFAITQTLVKEIGLYPPGTFLRLKNDEIAIVRGRTRDIKIPKVLSLVGDNGQVMKPTPRNVKQPEFAIREVVPSVIVKEFKISFEQLWPLMNPISLN